MRGRTPEALTRDEIDRLIATAPLPHRVTAEVEAALDATLSEHLPNGWTRSRTSDPEEIVIVRGCGRRRVTLLLDAGQAGIHPSLKLDDYRDAVIALCEQARDLDDLASTDS